MKVYVSNRKKTKKKIREQRSANVANDQGTIEERRERSPRKHLHCHYSIDAARIHILEFICLFYFQDIDYF